MKLSGAPVHLYTCTPVHSCVRVTRAPVHLCKPKASLPSSHLSTPPGAGFRGGWADEWASREIGNLKLLGVPVYLCARTPVYLCKSKASMLPSPLLALPTAVAVGRASERLERYDIPARHG